MAARLGFLSCLLLACASPPPTLGASDKDSPLLSEVAVLAHEAESIVGGDAMRVADLYRREAYSFARAPMPAEMLRAQASANPPVAEGAVAVSFLSYNVALLDVEGLGFSVVRSPDIDARRPLIARKILERGFDIVAVQELWLEADLRRFAEEAEALGYWIAHSDRAGYTDGLAVLVKKSFAEGPLAVGHEHYASIREIEFFPGPAVSRGFMWVKMKHATLGEIVVYDTHMASFPESYKTRMEHARELGLHLLANTDPNSQLILAAGDMNAGPYYAKDTWLLPNGQPQALWFANTLSYPLLLHYGELSDAVVRGRSLADATLDITLGDAVPNVPTLSTRVPGADRDYCERTPNSNFTGTDCNQSYFAQYAGTEFPARLDHVLVRDPRGRVHVERSGVTFTEPVDFGAVSGPLSDHYGVVVDLQVRPSL